LTVSAVNKMKNLLNMGFTNNNIKILPSLNREDYLKEIKIQAALLLGIDWPDESPVHKDELATIFPTKTVDYLISGRPIIVHCPENYFLGKFFKKHKCGFILNDRNTNSIEFQISQIFKDTNRLKQKVSNAFKASKQFHISSVKQVFESEL